MKLWGCVAALVLVGCAATMQVNGYPLDAEEWRYNADVIRRQAAFDLSCAYQSIELTVLRVDGDAATNVGATGCAKRTRYVRAREAFQYVWIRQN